MDFTNNGTQPQTVTPSGRTAASSGNGTHRKNGSFNNSSKWGRIVAVVLGAAIVILLVALITFIGFGSNANSEDKYVDSTKVQAVFLNTGQVYFGNIKALNNRYFELTNIYYLQTSNTNASSSASNSNANITLVKLGCELHEPYDKMIINSDQITFWENLQGGGQVAKAVATFEKQNPNGQKCADQSSSSSNTSNSVQSAGNSDSSSTDTTKKP